MVVAERADVTPGLWFWLPAPEPDTDPGAGPTVGTVASVVRLQGPLRQEGAAAVWTGIGRARLAGIQASGTAARVLTMPGLTADEAGRRALRLLHEHCAYLAGQLGPAGAPLRAALAIAGDDPNRLWHLAEPLRLTGQQRHRLLRCTGLSEAVEILTDASIRLAQAAAGNAELERQVVAGIGRSHRRDVLQRQYELIGGMLAADDEDGAGPDPLRELDGIPMSDEAAERARAEALRLRHLPSQSQEAALARTYLEWLVRLPWGRRSTASPSLASVEDALDRSHFGMRRIKDRLLEVFAVELLTNVRRDRAAMPVVCLVGPPGTGKTTIAHAFAGAIGRPFERIALGGIGDEAAIRGHRRGYVGAQPGRIIAAIRRAGVENPVLLLDEIDKLSLGQQSAAAAALLEILDTFQAPQFRDHFLDVAWDLRPVTFLATANDPDAIPLALRDRMEFLEVRGFTRDEKAEVLLRYQLPRQLARAGLEPEALGIGPAALEVLLRHYSREPGVRGLERAAAQLCRRLAVERVRTGRGDRWETSPGEIATVLGPPRTFGRPAVEAREPALYAPMLLAGQAGI
jgi:ATP-dependent Lon protease